MKMIGVICYLPWQLMFSFVIAPVLFVFLLFGALSLLCLIGGKEVRHSFYKEFLATTNQISKGID